MADFGWRDEAARSHYLRYAADMSGKCTVPFPGIEKLFQELAATRRSVAFRQEVCSDSDWYRSQLLNEFRRPAFNDGYVLSFVLSVTTGRCSHLGVHQDPTDAAPSARAKSIIDLLHRRLAPLIDSVLAGERHRSRQGLSPRLGQTLDRMLAGDSEKQIAAQLGISPPTVHEYVGKLYRHFNVNSHAELMAYFVGRQPQMR
jgi:DNA-binding CsgD family transcriptional regulator